MKKESIYRWVFALFLVAVFVGCSFEPPTTVASKADYKDDQLGFLALLKISGDYKIEGAELENHIYQLLNGQDFSGRSAALIEKTVITGSKKLPVSLNQNIANRSVVARSAVTDGNKEDMVDIYVFETENTAGLEGYVLATDDMRLGIVLAVVDGGSLEDEPEWWNDIIFEGIANYIDYTIDLYNNIDEDYIKQILGEPVQVFEERSLTGSGSKIVNGKGLTHHWYPNAPNVVNTYWSWTQGYTARGSSTAPVKTNWHQNYPYNTYVCSWKGGNAKNNDYITGCGPVAVAQLMAIWGKPTKSVLSSSFTYEWAGMRKDFTDLDANNFYAQSVAYLMYEIGRHSSAIYTKRTSNNGGASTSSTNTGIRTALKKMGYKTPNAFTTYNFSKVKSSIMAGRPVIATGLSKPASGGHYWLIDGVRKMSYSEYPASGSGYAWDNWDFIFCNAGWRRESANAWYVSGIFDFRDGHNSHVDRSNAPNYYQYLLYILPDVYY